MRGVKRFLMDGDFDDALQSVGNRGIRTSPRLGYVDSGRGGVFARNGRPGSSCAGAWDLHNTGASIYLRRSFVLSLLRVCVCAHLFWLFNCDICRQSASPFCSTCSNFKNFFLKESLLFPK